MNEPVVEVEHLRKEYGKKVAVEDLSFTVGRGEILGLLGANGAGKTTAIQMLLSLVEPTRGEIRMFGKSLRQHRPHILKRCNFSSAYTNLPHNLKVRENLKVFAKLYEVKEYQPKIDRYLERLEIAHLKNQITGQLSSGEMTRVNLCKALVSDPEILLLDEPTASLDPDMADKVRKLLRRIQTEQQTSMIYTSHNMRDVEEVCDRVILMHKGRIWAEGSPKSILGQFHKASLEEVFIGIARDLDSPKEEPS